MTAMAQPPGAADRRIRVMIVDDSAVARGLTRRWLETEPRIEIVRIVGDGAQAIAEAATARPDVLILDVEMPRMDGLAALPELRRVVPDCRIVMASSLTQKGAQTTLKALSLGAADYIAKPDAGSMGSAEAYRRDLIAKIMALAPRRLSAAAPGQAPAPVIKLRTPGRVAQLKPAVMVVAASTGGPAALQTFLTPIARRIAAPILIVQHMPATFTPVFAEKLAHVTGKPCREGTDGAPLEAGTMLLAPGDFHMRVHRTPAGGAVVKLDRSEAVNFCRPAADPLFDSAVQAFGGRVLAVVLTGMGHDGRAGSGRIVEAGGRVIVQDEASSVVWGMPGAVAQAGFAEAVKPLAELSQLAISMMNGEAS